MSRTAKSKNLEDQPLTCGRCGNPTAKGTVRAEHYIHFQGPGDQKFCIQYVFDILETPRGKQEVPLCDPCLAQCLEQSITEINDRIKRERKIHA